MSLHNEINELLEAGIIDSTTASDISGYYKSRKSSSSNRLFLVFGVLGALMIGLGIILILAHNWDNLSTTIKTIFAFLPIIIGQSLCGYSLSKKKDNITWKESSAVFLFLSIGACIALISQIYNMPGNLSGFLLIWMILALPIIYLMTSSAVSLMYVIGITTYVMESANQSFSHGNTWYYWLLLAGLMPYYYHLYKTRSQSNFITFHHWLIPISILFGFSMFSREEANFTSIGYLSLLGLYYMIGQLEKINKNGLLRNGYRVIGAVGSIGLLLSFSFSDFWDWMVRNGVSISSESLPSLLSAVIVSIFAFVIFLNNIKQSTFSELTPVMPVFLIFIPLFIIGIYFPTVSQALINLLILSIAVLTIRKGSKEDNLGILNYGLMIITALLICRFFDIHIGFIVKGILFILVGILFFIANYQLLKKRKGDA